MNRYISNPNLVYDLSENDWDKLISLNLVDAKGNGFANTTPNFDENISCTSNRYTHIKIEGMSYTFIVQYQSGCFYPIWKKASSELIDYIVKKDGSIIRNN